MDNRFSLENFMGNILLLNISISWQDAHAPIHRSFQIRKTDLIGVFGNVVETNSFRV